MTRTHLLKLIQLGLCIMLALSHLTLDKRLRAQQPPPNAVWEPAPSVGTCSRCGNWRWTDALGQPCQSFTCAQGTGYGAPVCQAVGNGGNFRHTFCDYNAGCPVGNGYDKAAQPQSVRCAPRTAPYKR